VTASAADYISIYGDIAKAYTIADRVGTTIEFVPHLFGANARPTGQRGWFMYRRVGGNLVNASAARLLNKSA
jgi:HK97 family phage major capsid protein